MYNKKIQTGFDYNFSCINPLIPQGAYFECFNAFILQQLSFFPISKCHVVWLNLHSSSHPPLRLILLFKRSFSPVYSTFSVTVGTFS